MRPNEYPQSASAYLPVISTSQGDISLSLHGVWRDFSHQLEMTDLEVVSDVAE